MMNKKKLRILFAGTPEFSAQHLQQILDSQYEVVAVLTQPDKPVGRGKNLQASAVKQLALAHNIDVIQVPGLKKEHNQKQVLAYDYDVMVVVAYGLIIPKVILEHPPLGCLNVHTSILPKWRGAAPIQRAIEAGEAITGVCVQKMDEGLDTGAILKTATLDIYKEDTSLTLFNRLAELGKHTLVETLDNLEELLPLAIPQEHSLTSYASKIDKSEGKIDWRLHAQDIIHKLRAFTPWPGIYFHMPDIENIKVIAANCLTLSLSNSEKVTAQDNCLLQKKKDKITEEINSLLAKLKVTHQSTREDLTSPQKCLTTDIGIDNISMVQVGQIVALTKSGLFIYCGDNTLLQITQLQMPSKKAIDAQNIFNSYKDLFKINLVLN